MASVAELQRSGIAYHIADERTFETGAISDGLLHIGQCAYRRVLLTADAVFTPTGHDLVERLRAAGTLANSLRLWLSRTR